MTPRSGSETREKLLDAAEAMILDQGYAATSIDRIIGEVGLTKGTFFYHFKNKGELARALIDRYARADERLLRENLARAERLNPDPLQQVLIFIGLFLEMADRLEEPYPGCLFASYCYESGLFDDEVNRVVATAILEWRRELGDRLRAAAERHPPRLEVDIVSLADMATVVFEGAFILSRSLQDPAIFAQQLRHYRDYIRLLFDA